MIQPGTVLAGKYQVERVLGQGGMGCVVAAMHLQLGQRVAIKFLLPEALRMHEAVERFLREARAAVRLRSEHVGRVIDVGQFDDGAPYMVMEFLEGVDLSGYLQRQGVLPVAYAVDFILQALEAISEAHSVGIVHRDLKPANLFMTRAADGSPLIKVLDFGISKAQQGDPSFNMTRTTSVMGSPGYMSPEQLRSTRDCDARTDIWALGVILFELTTGKTPFGGDSITELALKVAMDPTPAMNIGSTGFEAVVQRCLAKDPGQRFANVAELAAALVPYGNQGAMERANRIARVLQVQISAPAMPAYAGPTRIATATGPSQTGGVGQPTTLSGATGSGYAEPAPKRRTGLIVGVALGVVAVAGIAIALSMKSSPSSSSPSQDPSAAGKTKAAVDAGAKPQPPPPPPVDAAPPPPPPPPVDAALPPPPTKVDAGPVPKPKPRPKHRPKKGNEDDISNSRY
jgi:serine/threonine-protein kinase